MHKTMKLAVDPPPLPEMETSQGFARLPPGGAGCGEFFFFFFCALKENILYRYDGIFVVFIMYVFTLFLLFKMMFLVDGGV